MHLTELLDPKRGFLVDDICYIKVHIICAMKIVRTYQPKLEPVQALTGVTILALTAPKNEKTGHSKEKKEKAHSVEAMMIQSAGDSSMSVSNKKPGENQNTEAKDEKRRSLSFSNWFQERIEKIEKYFDRDGTRYQRLPDE
ncbi:hypothetical protein MKW92_042138 [Papaver armeniacum]|nr:hypothetical protein MKW92_042138 [Papaver armeniacum]